MSAIGPAPEDFVVDEIPAYPAAGTGSHVFCTVEKRGLTTTEAVRRLAEAVGCPVDDIGVAGLKDRHAVTRQRLSFPPPVTPEQLLAVALPDLRVLGAERHGHKLRTGHLAGNRFGIRVVGVAADEVPRLAAALAAFGRPPGMPNAYGAQRFGARGDNAARGLEVVAGRLRVQGRERRFLVSALQADLFNRYLEARRQDGLLGRCIEGDVMRTGRGGLFASTDPALDEARMATGEIVPSGPMFGHSMRQPAPGTAAAAREDAILAGAGLTTGDFARPWIKRLAEGTRRPLTVLVADGAVVSEGDGVRISFTLPPGSFATVCLAELLGHPIGSATLRPPPGGSSANIPPELEDFEASP